MDATVIWDPEPIENQDVYPLPRADASTFGVRTNESTYGTWVRHGGDPRLYPFSPTEYAQLEHWWIADLSALPTADLESELEYTTGRIVALRLTPEVADGNVDGVQYGAILDQRAAWLTWEISRRNALPDPPRVGFKLSSDFIHRLKDACDLPEFLVGELGFSLKRQGRDFVGLCPFHAEKTASFVVHSDRWHCFGCGQSGDVFDALLVSSTCRTWREAVELVARRVGVSMPRPPEQRRAPAPPPTRVVSIQGISVPTL